MALGIGNFLYDIEVKDGSATYNFRDPEDTANTASVSLSKDDLGEYQADSREATDLAFNRVEQQLNNKRDARHATEEKNKLDEDLKDAKADRARTQDFFDNTEDGSVKPDHVEQDGTTVYNTAPLEDAAPAGSSDDGTDDKKKK
jgi:hypothetical protein